MLVSSALTLFHTPLSYPIVSKPIPFYFQTSLLTPDLLFSGGFHAGEWNWRFNPAPRATLLNALNRKCQTVKLQRFVPSLVPPLLLPETEAWGSLRLTSLQPRQDLPSLAVAKYRHAIKRRQRALHPSNCNSKSGYTGFLVCIFNLCSRISLKRK